MNHDIVDDDDEEESMERRGGGRQSKSALKSRPSQYIQITFSMASSR